MEYNNIKGTRIVHPDNVLDSMAPGRMDGFDVLKRNADTDEIYDGIHDDGWLEFLEEVHGHLRCSHEIPRIYFGIYYHYRERDENKLIWPNITSDEYPLGKMVRKVLMENGMSPRKIAWRTLSRKGKSHTVPELKYFPYRKLGGMTLNYSNSISFSEIEKLLTHYFKVKTTTTENSRGKLFRELTSLRCIGSTITCHLNLHERLRNQYVALNVTGHLTAVLDALAEVTDSVWEWERARHVRFYPKEMWHGDG